MQKMLKVIGISILLALFICGPMLTAESLEARGIHTSPYVSRELCKMSCCVGKASENRKGGVGLSISLMCFSIVIGLAIMAGALCYV